MDEPPTPAPTPKAVAAITAAVLPDFSTVGPREKGLRALTDGLYDMAEKFFLEYRESVRKKQPELADATILLIKTGLRRQQLAVADAAVAYHDHRKLELTDADFRDALTYWRGALLIAHGQWDAAISTLLPLTVAAGGGEYRALALDGLVTSQVHLQHWAEAEAACRRLVSEYPAADPQFRYRLALVRILAALGHTDEAGQELDKLEKLKAPAVHITLHRVLIELARKHWQEGWAQFKLAEPLCEGAGDYPDDYFIAGLQLAAALMEQRHEADAIPVLEKLLTRSGVAAEKLLIRVRLTECHIVLEQMEAAISALEALRRDFSSAPELAGLDIRLADALNRAKSYLTAAEYYGNASDNEQADADLRFRAAYNRGTCLREAGQFANAQKAFLAAAKLGAKPEQQSDATFYAAEAAFRQPEFAVAAQLFQTVADSWPDAKLAEQARFNQAMAHTRSSNFAAAVPVLRQYLQAYPNSGQRQDARLELGRALRQTGAHAAAITELQGLIEAYPDGTRAPAAMMEAYQAAFAAADTQGAMGWLSRLLAEYPQADLYPQALYQRIHLKFSTHAGADALADAKTFLEKFPKLPLAADILLWLGDHYTSIGDPQRAEEYYLQLPQQHPASGLAPMALQLAARSSFQRGDLQRAETLATQILKNYPAAGAKPLATAEFLLGDILASQGKFADAAVHFAKVSEFKAGDELSWAATGRLGEMHYSLAADLPATTPAVADAGVAAKAGDEHQSQALAIFARLVAADSGAPLGEKEKARYRLAKIYEKLNRNDDAIKEYLEIVYQYDLDLREGRVRDWFYFARSGYDAARLLLLANRNLEAVRLYERLAATRIPTAAEAAAKAAEIRKAHAL